MISRFALCAALAAIPLAPAAAQMADMPGMTMPMPTTKPAAKPAPVVYHHDEPATPVEVAPPAMDPAMPGMEQGGHSAAGGTNPAMTGHNHHLMSGAYGNYLFNREASGTAWQPDLSRHEGLHGSVGDWTLMAHGALSLVADTQSGRRGDDKLFLAGHVMATARRPLGGGTLQLRTILSPEPLMGKRGYPLLLASGETADGVTRLIDRQHPHDFIGELSASYSLPLSPGASVFVYAGLPGEPAFGPPAYLHREAILDSPEAPITHHWLDSTHVTEGVITAGLVVGRVKVEGSRFNGREPNQHRWDIETGPLDSTALRLSWNPTSQLSLQTSWTRLKDPEQLEPGIDQTRWSASALYAADLGVGHLAATLAWGRRTAKGRSDDAFAAEASLKRNAWTLFSRAETTQNNELVANIDDGPAYRVGKASLGLIRNFRLVNHVSVGIGGLVSVNFVPNALAPLYGGHNPKGAMGFLRFRLD